MKHVFAAILTLGLVSALPHYSSAQNMTGFEATPTSNSCTTPPNTAVLFLGPQCSQTLGPGAGTVLTCGLMTIQAMGAGWGGNYTPATDDVIPPGYLCFFYGCSPALISLQCYKRGTGQEKALVMENLRTFGFKPAP